MADGDSANLELVRQLRRVAGDLERLGAGFAAANGMHPTDLRALTLLIDARRAGVEVSPGWLSEHLVMNSAGVTSLLKRLERLGYIRRLSDAQDKRRVRIELDGRAEQVGSEFLGSLGAGVASASDGFNERELKTVRRFLDNLPKALRSA